jgi:hypothetical protein
VILFRFFLVLVISGRETNLCTSSSAFLLSIEALSHASIIILSIDRRTYKVYRSTMRLFRVPMSNDNKKMTAYLLDISEKNMPLKLNDIYSFFR